MVSNFSQGKEEVTFNFSGVEGNLYLNLRVTDNNSVESATGVVWTERAIMINILTAVNRPPFFLHDIEDVEVQVGDEFKIGLGSYRDTNQFDEHELVISLIDGIDMPEFLTLDNEILLVAP